MSRSNAEVPVDRRGGKDRRSGKDRRQVTQPVAEDRRKGQRRKVQRRRQIDPTTCERDYTADEIEFMQALDAYKRNSGRMFPTCSEILEVVKSLGYRKVTASVAGCEPCGSANGPDAGSSEPTADAEGPGA